MLFMMKMKLLGKISQFFLTTLKQSLNTSMWLLQKLMQHKQDPHVYPFLKMLLGKHKNAAAGWHIQASATGTTI